MLPQREFTMKRSWIHCDLDIDQNVEFWRSTRVRVSDHHHLKMFSNASCSVCLDSVFFHAVSDHANTHRKEDHEGRCE